ncbi:hypothetical protein IX84_11755, partial [Phaeodactylibacter xiamenensis]
NGAYDDATGIWTIGDLANGASVSLEVTASVNATGDYFNVAEVSEANEDDTDSTPDNDDGDQSEDDEDSAETTPNPIIDLELTKVVDNATPNVGEEVTFTVTVENQGPSDATGVAVRDNLPSGYTFVSSNGAYDDATGIWTIGDLANGASVSLEITASVNATGDYFNVAEVSEANEDDTDSTPDNDDGDQSEDDEDSAETTPNPIIDLELTKVVDNATPNVGEEVTFTVTVENQGPSDATGVAVRDNLPSGYTFVSSNGAYDDATGIWTIGDLANGASVSLEITASVNATGDYFNVAEVSEANEDDTDSTPDNDDGDQSEDDEDSAETTPNPIIDLELTKVVDNATPNVGEEVTFTVTVENQGPSDATGVAVRDNLPSGYTFVSSNGAYDDATGIWTIGDLANGASVSLEITASVNATGDYFNVAEVSEANEDDTDSTPDNDDGDQSEDDEDSAETTPNPIIDLELTKVVDNATPNVGEEVTFTVTVENQGPSDATGVAVRDNLPSGYTFVSSNGAYDDATGIWTIGDLANGASVSLEITASVNATGDYFNVAEVSEANEDDTDSTPDNDDGDQSEDDEDSAETTPNPIIDLELTKVVDNATPNVGEEVTFTVTVENQGPSDATGVAVRDNLPSGYTFVSSNGAYDDATGIWTIGDLANGASVSLEITASVNATGDYFNVAEVSEANEDDTDSTPDNDDGDQSEDDEDSAETTPNPIIDLELTKVVDNATPNVGEEVTFTVTVENQGPSDATGVAVRDNLPSGYTFVSSNGAYDDATGIWTIGDLANGASVSLEITASVNATGDYFNVAEVSEANEDDTDSTPDNDDGDQSEDDEDSAETTPNPIIDLELTKVVDNATPNVGEEVTFTVTVENQGPSDATGVAVRDNLPSGYTFVSSNGAYDDATGIWTIGDLANGASVSLEITASVNATGDYFNVAEVSEANEDDTDSTPDNDDGDQSEDDEDSAETDPNPIIDLELTKVVDNATPNVGEEVTFTVTVENQGPSDATGVAVRDNL